MTAVVRDDPTDEPVDDTPPGYWEWLLNYVIFFFETKEIAPEEKDTLGAGPGSDSMDGGT